MRELNILYLTDNNYAVFAGVSMTSLFLNNKNVDRFTVYVIDDNIAQDNKDKMQALAAEYGHKVVFLDLSSGIRTLESMGIPKYRNSYTTYLKLLCWWMSSDGRRSTRKKKSLRSSRFGKAISRWIRTF